MSNQLTVFRQALLLAALAVLLPFYGLAQQVTVNRIYDFSGGDTVNSELNYVYADSNRIIALGHASPAGEKPYVFTAAFDYSGNLLWKKPIQLPDNLLANTLDSAYNVLIKAAPNLYVAGWNMVNVPKAGNYVSQEPFLYFFNAQGDSVRFLQLPDSMKDNQLNALALDRDGHIVVSGNSRELYPSSGQPRLRYFWFYQLDSQGQLLRQNQFSLSSVLNWYYFSDYRPRITKMIPTSLNHDSIHYVVAVNTGDPQYCGQIFWLDSLFNPIPPIQYFNEFPGVSDVFDGMIVMPTRLPRFEFNLVARKGHPHSYFWSFPAEIYGGNLSVLFSEGVYFCRSRIYWQADTAINYHLDWHKAFVIDTALMPSISLFSWDVQDRSEMEETANGDLLVQRTIARSSDTISLDPLSFYYFPVLFRVEDTGRYKWGRSFQYIHTVDSGIFHRFYDLSIAPDGKIVMVGVLRSRYGVPGYDTIGKASWLVVLSDTLHDQQPQPSEPEGVVVLAAGQQVGLSLYPNPTIGNTVISLQKFKGNVHDFSWQLLSLDGRLLQTHQMEAIREEILLNSYAPGVYFLRLSYNGEPLTTVKVVKE